MLSVTASTTQASWLGGDAITLSATGLPASMTARLTSGNKHYPCVSGRVGQQQIFFALGGTVVVYTPQVVASVQAYTLELLDASGTVIAQVPINVLPPQYGSATFALRALLPVNYAAGATSLTTVDQQGY